MNEESAQSLLSSLRSIPESKPTVEEKKQQTQEEANERAKEVVVKEKEKTAADAEKETSGEEKEAAMKEKTVLEAKEEARGEKEEVAVKEENTITDAKIKVIEEKETPVDTRERCWKGVINGVEFTFVVSVPSQTTCRIAIRRKGSCKLFYSPQKNEVPFTAVFRNQSVSFSVDPKSKIKEVRAIGLMVVMFAVSQV